MSKSAKHYFASGKEHRGGMHKHPDGSLMTGKVMSNTSKKLFHYGDLSSKAKMQARKSWKRK